MGDELRVPPSVTMAFEGAATQICNDAKLDYDEWPLRAYETVTHLQERWRKCIQDGMGTDEAERQALRSFGDLSVVARSHRKPWHVRMLIHQRCRADRFFFFLAAYVFFSWLAVLDVHFRGYLDGKPPDMAGIMLPFNPNALDGNERYPSPLKIIASIEPRFFIEGLGTFFVGLAAVASVVAIHWRSNFKNRLLNQIFLSRYLLSVVAIFAVVMLSIWPAYLTWKTLKLHTPDLFYQGYCLLHISGIFLGWFGAACLISELFDFPGMMRKRRDHNRPFVVVA